MKKTKSKILSGILALTMVVGMLPLASVEVQAAETEYTMALGMSGVKSRDITGLQSDEAGIAYEGDKIVMGTYDSSPVEWVRLNNDGLMFSIRNLGTTAFESDRSGYYSDSDNELQAAMLALYDNGLGLTDKEKTLIKNTTLTKESMGDGSTYIPSETINDLAEQKFFPLSGNDSSSGEFHDYVGVYTELAKDSSAPFWWLRSSFNDYYVFLVWDIGNFYNYHVDFPNGGVRPAYNLNLESVLFTSAAEGGKSSLTVGEADPILGEISGTAPTTWKMTILDSARSFAVSSVVQNGNEIDITYSSATTGVNEYISVMIVDSSDNITHYGKIANNSASGTASFTIPSGITGDVKLKIFNEQDNGDNKTDLSSAFVEKTVTIKEPNNLQSVTQSDVVYDTAVDPKVTYNGTQNGVDPTFTYKAQSAEDNTYTTTAPQYVGDYTVKATSAENDTALEGTATDNFSITAIDQTPTITATTSVQAGNDIDLSTLVSNAKGTVSFTKVSGEGTLTGTTYTAPSTTGTAVFTVNITAKDVNDDGENEYNAYTSASAITVTITATPITYRTITFDANGGNGTMTNVQVADGTSYTLPANDFTAPTDKEFKAWEIGGTEYAVGATYTVNADTEIKALWKEKAPVITPPPTGGGGSSSNDDPVIESGKNQTITQGQAITFVSDEKFSNYKYTEVNGKKVDEKYLTVESGSTKVTLSAEFTKTLSAGKHTIEIVSTTGKAKTTFTVEAKENPNTGHINPQTSVRFEDIKSSDWFSEYVYDVVDKGLFSGTSETEFSPNDNATRAMVWTVLARMDNGDVTGGEMWYSKAQKWAMENEVSDGTNPDGLITREQFVTMLWRFEAPEQATMQTVLGKFDDEDEISQYAVTAMEWAVSEGIISGKTENTLDPQGNLTRAEMATILSRFTEAE